MADNHTKEQRSYNMSRIRSKNTSPELKLKKILEKKGYLYQFKIFGNPDFIHLRKKIVVFIDGCFWHKCPIHYKKPQSNQEYWFPKLEKNEVRDREINIAYKNLRWKVIRIWEHNLKTTKFINPKILNKL